MAKSKEKKKEKKEKKPKKEEYSNRKGEYGAFADVMDAIYEAVQVKLIFFLFILFILVNTSEFVEKILSQFPGAVEGRSPSTKGIFIQGFILCIMLMIIDALITQGLL